MTISWDAVKMATGVAVVDDEHKEWIRRFNEFEREVTSGRGVDSVNRTLDFMVEYSENHFAHEETLAEGRETPAVLLNHTEHDKFRRKVNELREWIKEYGASSVEVLSLKMDLEEWLVHHICYVDAQVWADQAVLQDIPVSLRH